MPDVKHAERQFWRETRLMTDSAEQQKTGRITIEWVVGSDPADATTYGWHLRAEPVLPDPLVVGLLAEISNVY
jgi:hypothetical protein